MFSISVINLQIKY